MRSEVLYRDLPGGPLPVKFADEVSLWCLCSKCGMYANDMFQDSASHVFCSVCIFECSDRKKIHCKHEKKDVPVDDMIQAVDVRQVMRDQIVFCPNNNGDNGCTTYCALKDLQVHYLECAGTEINCLCCGGVVKGLDWERHINTCPQQILQCRYCLVAIPRCRLQAHEELCYDNPGASQQSRSTTPPSDPSNLCSQPSQRKERKANFDSTAHNGAPVTEMQVHSGGSIMQCIYCKRNVKRKNIERHQEVCGQKKRPAVSDVGKSPGNIEITPDLRNTPTVGQYDPLGQAASFQNSSPLRVQPRGHSRNIPVVAPSDFPPDETTLQNSFASCGSHLIARDSKSASIFGSNDPIQEATALRNTFTLCSQQSTATDSRSPSTLGSNDPVREASRNSFTSSSQQSDNSWVIVNGRAACPYTESCETPPGCPEMAEEALRSSIVNCGMDAVSAKVASAITTAVKFPTALLSAAGRLLSGNYGDGADLAVADHESSPEKYEEASVHQETVAHSSQKVTSKLGKSND